MIARSNETDSLYCFDLNTVFFIYLEIQAKIRSHGLIDIMKTIYQTQRNSTSGQYRIVILTICIIGVLFVLSGCSRHAAFDLRNHEETFVFTDTAATEPSVAPQKSETTTEPSRQIPETTHQEETTAQPTTEYTTAAPTEAATETPATEDAFTNAEATAEEAGLYPSADILSQPDENAQAYVLNTNTKKFHYPTCSSVKQIKSKNRQDVYMNREAIISDGFEPCKRCNP